MVDIGHGSATRRQLTGLVSGYIPMMLFSLLAIALSRRQYRRREAGLLDERERSLLQAETNRLFSFGVGLVSVMLFGQLLGNIIVTRL